MTNKMMTSNTAISISFPSAPMHLLKAAYYLSISIVLSVLFITTSAKAHDSLADLAHNLLPTVVNISTTQNIEPRVTPQLPNIPKGSPFEKFFEDFMDRRNQQLPTTPPSSLGSGFVIDAKKGYIVTNNHVIRDADEVKITLHDDTVLPAEIVGRDEKTDLAILKVDPEAYPLKEAKLGDSDVIRVGDWVMAIGNPFGLGGTVTSGIISARQRDINSGPYDDYLQTDASINRGNSGGPMFNMDGDVIGINTAIYSPTGGSVGIGFAIPSVLARPILEQLIKYGRTRRGWLGIRIQLVTEEIANSLGLDTTQGALVASLTKTGPAEKAGIRAGDVVLKFNGKAITEMRHLPRVVAETDINKDVPVVIWRDGALMTLSVKIGELEKAEETGLLETDTKTSGKDDLGGAQIRGTHMLGSRLTIEHRNRFEITGDIDGVIITKVESGSNAAEKGLRPGDVILEINQNKVSDPRNLNGLIKNARKSGRSSVLFLIDRGGDTQFIALRLSE